ncbi:hypothetical protein [Curvivirga aplysinae]|uniref:hypothetical protein n=1 Tax=Curvivirga aplysinae TaxID=2529852 RepID=UPI0012BC13CB|nr:hypothetical protein [Curvivirga aplysinae]MTI09515.1 hypothetical protein [Curvivirga aplysinae]
MKRIQSLKIVTKLVMIFSANAIFLNLAGAYDVIDICYEEWPPFIETTETGDIKGSIVPLLNELRSKLPTQINLLPIPYVRCLKGIETGIYDGILMDDSGHQGLLSTDFKTADWELSMLVRKGEYAKLQDLIDDKKAIVGFPFEYDHPESVTSIFEGRIEQIHTKPEIIYKLMTHDRMAAVLEDKAWLLDMIERHNWQGFEVLEPSMYRIEQFLNIHPRRKEFVPEVNAAIRSQ